MDQTNRAKNTWLECDTASPPRFRPNKTTPAHRFMWEDEVQEVVRRHWEFVDGILDAHGVTENDRELIGFHYRIAMGHGFKHGVRWREEYDRRLAAI